MEVLHYHRLQTLKEKLPTIKWESNQTLKHPVLFLLWFAYCVYLYTAVFHALINQDPWNAYTRSIYRRNFAIVECEHVNFSLINIHIQIINKLGCMMTHRSYKLYHVRGSNIIIQENKLNKGKTFLTTS